MNKAASLFLLAVLACSPALRGQEPQPRGVMVRFQDRIRGYDGTRDASISSSAPDLSIGRKDNMLVGRIHGTESRGLIRFTGLDIPRFSRILSARLTLAGIGRDRPRVAAHGLLKEFAEQTGDVYGAGSRPVGSGETTWNMLHHGAEAWTQPGAARASAAFVYDADADHHAQPDDVVEREGIGLWTWDVTRSFADQFAHGKEYGWLLVQMAEGDTTYADFQPREQSLGDKVLVTLPSLAVTFVPADPGYVGPPLREPKLLSFYLATRAWELLEQPERLAALPFDGVVLFGTPDSGRHESCMALNTFAAQRLRLEDFGRFIEAGRALARPPSPLTDNFLRVNLTTPGTLEPVSSENRPRGADPVTMWWTDGFDSVLHNIRVVATVAREARMKGIWFDWEVYQGDIWSHDAMKDARELGKGLEETMRQVRMRAEQVMQVLNEVYPDMTIVVIHTAYHPDASALWNRFMDGLLAAADPRIRFIDGNEQTYQVSSAEGFWREYDFDYREAPQLSGVPAKYRRQIEVAFGAWFDNNGWSADPEVYNYSSAMWQAKLERALTISDGYVWVYTGSGGGALAPDWWTGRNLPDSYVEATRQARQLVRLRRAIGMPRPPSGAGEPEGN